MLEKTISHDARTSGAPLITALPGCMHCTWSPAPHTSRIARRLPERNAT